MRISESVKGFLGRCLLLAALAAVFTFAVVRWSLENGKLSVMPDYDDSHSLVEGALRWQAFAEGGLVGGLRDYLQRIPHSFLHYYWTGLLFAVFGIHEEVPYLANAVFVFLVLMVFWEFLPASLSWLQKALYALAFLGMPVMFHLVHDFRSEVTMAALFFSGAGLAVAGSWDRSLAKRLGGVILIGLGMAMKPVMFLYGLGMLGLCGVVFWVAQGHHRLPWSKTLLESTLWGLLAVAPVATHLAIFHETILNYIRNVAFVSDFYKLQLGWFQILTFHWLGYSGLWHLGALKTVLALWVGLALALPLLPHFRNCAPPAKTISLCGVMLGAFGGIAINQVNQPFFGMTFQMLLVAVALLLFAHYLELPRARAIPLGVLAVWAVYFFPKVTTALFGLMFAGLLGSLALFIWFEKKCSPFAWKKGLFAAVPVVFLACLTWVVAEVAPYHNYRERTLREEGAEGLAWRQYGAGLVWEAISPSLGWPEKKPTLWVAAYGWVDGNTLSWEAARRGHPLKVFNYPELPLEKGQKVPAGVDFVLLPEPGLLGSLPSPYDRALAELWENEDWKTSASLVLTLPGPDGKSLRLYSLNKDSVKSGQDAETATQ